MRCGNSDIVFSENDQLEFGNILNDNRTVVLLFDNNTYEYCSHIVYDNYPFLKNTLKYIVKPGEEHKTIDTCLDIWDTLINENILKNSLLICIGGGVISDIGGFIASIYKRGIEFIFIPTTLLAQVDASLGGKNGVDFKSGKNQLGLISFPSLINISPKFLDTLPNDQIISGYAEVVKYALIWDKDFWRMLLTIDHLEGLNWLPVIKRSIKIKSEIVDKDPYEKGIRKSLNFGHTIGHAIESIYLKKGQPILHGDAIAAGMECELYISSHYYNWNLDKIKKIINYLRQIFPNIKLEHQDMDELIHFMKNDKKNRGDGINFTLIEDVGKVIVDQIVPEEIIRQVIELYISLRSDDKLTS